MADEVVFHTIRDFGKRFGPGVTRTYELINSGEIKAVKFGARTFITDASARAWAARLPAIEPKVAA